MFDHVVFGVSDYAASKAFFLKDAPAADHSPKPDNDPDR